MSNLVDRDLVLAAIWLWQHPHTPSSWDGKDIIWRKKRAECVAALTAAGFLKEKRK